MVTCTHPVITCLNKYPAYNGVSGRERGARKGTNATLLVLSNPTMLRPARRKEIGLIDQE